MIGFMTDLDKKFFERYTPLVAKELLGKKIIRVYCGKKIEGIITETEAYHGFEDKASHASRGKTEKKNYPAAVLIRGIYANGKAINGPGRVCRFLKIDKKYNESALSKQAKLWVEKGVELSPKKIKKALRIGVDYAGPIWSKKLWRFYIKSDTV